MVHTMMGTFFCLALAAVWTSPAWGQRQMENLTRGVVAVKLPRGGAYVSWRLLGTDPESIAFNIYRSSGHHDAVQVNGRPTMYLRI